MTKRKQLTDALYKFYQKPVAKVSLELFMSIGAVLFFAIFAIRPTLLTMSDLIKEIEDKRNLDQQMSQKIASLSTAQSTYLSLQERLSILDFAIPDSPQFTTAIKLLEKVASEQNLVITSIIVNDIPEEKTIEISKKEAKRVDVPISIVITGEFNSIKQFIENILNLRRAFVVDTVVFAKSDDRGKERLKATITLVAPYFGEEK